MVAFPNCKINIGLYITQKRDDGFHNLETIFYPVPWCDVLEMVPASGKSSSLQVYGLPVNGAMQDNIVWKAYSLLQKKFPDLPAFDMHLLKAIPTGAGLGGGSADGAFALKMINDLANLHLSEAELIDLALQLGSDCPFFISNKPCLGDGRGEILTPMGLSLQGWQILLINPGIHVPTGWAFQQLQPKPADFNLAELQQYPVAEWRHLIRNDFEKPVANTYTAIRDLVLFLYEQGATYAAMSGSGSTVFGLFPTSADLSQLKIDEAYKPFAAILS